MITIAISNPDESPLQALCRMLETLRSQWWRIDSMLVPGDRVVIRDSCDGETLKVFEIVEAGLEPDDAKEVSYP